MMAMHEGGTTAIVFGPSAASTCRTDSASMHPGHAACPEQSIDSSCNSSIFMGLSPSPDSEHRLSVAASPSRLPCRLRTNSAIFSGETLTPPTPAR